MNKVLCLALLCLQLCQAKEKACHGIGNMEGPMRTSETVHANNVHYFNGCTIIRGNVIFEAYAFKGDRFNNIPPMTADMVKKAFSSVKVIQGYLKILSWPSELHNFSVFSNLEAIRGSQLFRRTVALVIQDTPDPSDSESELLSQVTSLGFRSLKTINYGNVYIGFMRNLCYENTVNWTKILKNPTSRVNFYNGVLLRNNKKCNETCDSLCDSNGCWGPGYQNCFLCTNSSKGVRCITDCGEGSYKSQSECQRCDDQCIDCYGEGPSKCFQCKHFNHTGTCVESCPIISHANVFEKVCEPYGEAGLREEISRLEEEIALLRHALSKFSPKEPSDFGMFDRA